MVSMLSEKSICAPPRLSEVSATSPLKDKSKVRGDFLSRFPLKLAENDDVGETVI